MKLLIPRYQHWWWGQGRERYQRMWRGFSLWGGWWGSSWRGRRSWCWRRSLRRGGRAPPLQQPSHFGLFLLGWMWQMCTTGGPSWCSKTWWFLFFFLASLLFFLASLTRLLSSAFWSVMEGLAPMWEFSLICNLWLPRLHIRLSSFLKEGYGKIELFFHSFRGA